MKEQARAKARHLATVQVLPADPRSKAIASFTGLLAKEGVLLVICWDAGVARARPGCCSGVPPARG